MTGKVKSETNLHIWDQVEETAIGATKVSKFEGREQTSINGTAMFKVATSIWGPVGIGWGYTIIEDQFQHGGPIVDDQGQKIADNMLHTIKLELWYMDGDKKGSVIHFGHTPFIYKTKYGPKTDFEAPKKSLTDAIKKCLSMLGFSADIYMGMFDDIEYVNAQKMKDQIKKAEDSTEELIALRDEFRDWVSKEIESYPLIPIKASLKLVCNGHLKSASLKCQALNIPFESVKKMFTDAMDKQVLIIDKKQKKGVKKNDK